MSEIKVLIIEDHPLIIDSYKRALAKVQSQNNDINFTIVSADTIDKAIYYINNANKNEYSLVFLDIQLPKSTDGKILSGEDLGVIIRNQMPNSKIIVNTSYNDNFRLNNILNSLNPEGFLIKNDLVPKDLIIAIEAVIDDSPYYNKTVLKLLRKRISNDFMLDEKDRKLLYELSLGAKTVDLPKLVSMSQSGIEYRKKQMRDIFNAKNDKELIKVAKEKGFI